MPITRTSINAMIPIAIALTVRIPEYLTEAASRHPLRYGVRLPSAVTGAVLMQELFALQQLSGMVTWFGSFDLESGTGNHSM